MTRYPSCISYVVALLSIYGLFLIGRSPEAEQYPSVLLVSSNRADVEFYVRAGERQFEIGPPVPSIRPQTEAGPNQWLLYLDKIRQALVSQFGLSSESIDFSQLCARTLLSDNRYREYCRQMASLGSAKSLSYSFFESSHEYRAVNTTINILNSPGAIVGSNNSVKEYIKGN